MNDFNVTVKCYCVDALTMTTHVKPGAFGKMLVFVVVSCIDI